jgi:hypothetical protein
LPCIDEFETRVLLVLLAGLKILEVLRSHYHKIFSDLEPWFNDAREEVLDLLGLQCGLLQFEQLIVPVLVDLHIVGELKVPPLSTVSCLGNRGLGLGLLGSLPLHSSLPPAFIDGASSVVAPITMFDECPSCTINKRGLDVMIQSGIVYLVVVPCNQIVVHQVKCARVSCMQINGFFFLDQVNERDVSSPMALRQVCP